MCVAKLATLRGSACVISEGIPGPQVEAPAEEDHRSRMWEPHKRDPLVPLTLIGQPLSAERIGQNSPLPTYELVYRPVSQPVAKDGSTE